MRIAYLIDTDAIGGGTEYVRRQRESHPGDECRQFFSDRGECTSRQMDAWGADEIVVNHLRSLMQLLWNPFCRPRGRVTFVVHGVHLRKYVWQVRESGGRPTAVIPWTKGMLRRGLEAWLYHRCDGIVALTEGDRADILRWYGRGLDVVVRPNTLDGWAPNLAEGLPPGVEGRFMYVCIGRFDYQKGQDRLIRWLSGKRSGRHASPAVLFVGDGETLEPCKALARKLKVADRCVFAGAIHDADRYLKCAESVVSPSRWEGMPYLLMKARALGCRILATDCPGNREVLVGYDKWEKLEL